MTDLERQAIRRHKRDNPTHKQSEIRVWFNTERHAAITQGMVSTALSSQFSYLDTDARKPRELAKSKRTPVPD